MNLRMPDDIYLVKGYFNHCIYDLKRGELYHINNKLRQLIELAVSQAYEDSSYSDEENLVLRQLINTNLLEECPQLTSLKDITSLKRDYPISFAWIEVTRQCNLTCGFCYESSSPHCHEKLALSQHDIVAENLIELGVKRIQYIGGEPLLLKDELKQMISKYRHFFDFVEVYTNGIKIDEAWCQFFKNQNIHIALSIHSYIPEEHDKVTQVKGSHRKVIKALSLLQKYQIPYRIGTVRSKSCNVGSRNKTDHYTLQPKLPKVTGRADPDQFDFEMFKQKAITKETKRHRLNKETIIKHTSGHQCFVKDVYIDTKLEVYPCVMERRLSHGNLEKSRLKDIINDRIRYLSKDNIEGCKDCEFRYGCFDCRPDANERGFYNKPWFCSYNPKTGEWADLKMMYENLNKKNKISLIPVKVVTS